MAGAMLKANMAPAHVNTYCTDSLSQNPPTFGRGSAQVKSRLFDVVVANPPYGYCPKSKELNSYLIPFAIPAFNFDEEGNEIDFSESVFLPIAGKVPPKESNRGKLRDSYALFFGLADRKLREGGTLSYITPNTWLSIPTYKYLRKYFLTNYTIHYIVNFNNISSRDSIFLPDAGVAASVVVMTKAPPPKGHCVRFLDLSSTATVQSKFAAFSTIQWKDEDKATKTYKDISNFTLKEISSLPFVEREQSDFLQAPEYILRTSSDLLQKIVRGTQRLSDLVPTYQGVGAGSVSLLVASSRSQLRDKVENIVFTGKTAPYGKTIHNHIQKGLREGNIDLSYDCRRDFPFAFQKDFKPYCQPPLHWIYMDHNILWRSRSVRDGKPVSEIFETHKLLVLERRTQGRILASVSRSPFAPQAGGRFFYSIPVQGTTVDDLYVLAALINSSVVNYYYRKMGQGDKDIFLKPLASLPKSLYRDLLCLSKEIHDICQEGPPDKCPSYRSLVESVDRKVASLYDLTSEEISEIQRIFP
tara:strand:+ start:2004 stop:3587 length:1584 start_codon:yes stop_codon:yes gene_type:complete